VSDEEDEEVDAGRELREGLGWRRELGEGLK